MAKTTAPGDDATRTPWIADPAHRHWLTQEAARQFAFFAASPRPDAGFYTLGYDGAPLPSAVQELHTTTRLVHSYALGQLFGAADSAAVVDAGMAYLWSHHRDADHGGYLWALEGDHVTDGRKLAYGHVFVLLAGASALMVGHPDAPRLIDDVSASLDQHFWEDGPGLFCDEWNRDWTPFSTYRGMNANMHGVEALLTAYEATGREIYLTRAGRILDFFLGRVAPEYEWRLPEHYTADWQVDRGYSGNPMFRPAGTTPGHSFELARLWLQYWDLSGRPDADTPERAAALVRRTLDDAWDKDRGGFVYTLGFDGKPAIGDRYWWPVTEAIGVIAALQKHAPSDEMEGWYRRLWQFADAHFIDHAHGGWFPEIGADNRPTVTQFDGKPDIYHSIQATLFPLVPRLSRIAPGLAELTE